MKEVKEVKGNVLGRYLKIEVIACFASHQMCIER